MKAGYEPSLSNIALLLALHSLEDILWLSAPTPNCASFPSSLTYDFLIDYSISTTIDF